LCFNINNTRISQIEITVPILTTVFFTADPSGIPGKVDHKWEIINSNTGELLYRSSKERITWSFCDMGFYDVSLEISDSNGNISNIVKKGIIKVTPDA